MKLFLFSSALRLFVSLLMSFLLLSHAHAQEIYQIDDIQILGLQRVSAASVFSAIDIEAGTQVSDTQLQNAIRDLFDTGFFDDVNVGQENNVLIISLTERPVISKLIIEGNKILDTDALLEGLGNIGLAEGEVFKQSALEAISKQLNSQYGALGRYSAEINTQTQFQTNNQVIVGIQIDEGRVAKIKQIRIVGNKEFKGKKLQKLFGLNKTGTWSWVTGNDKYAREQLSGDLEKLKSFYLDRGFLNFRVKSTQVSLSPDKEAVFITVNVTEGEKLRIGEIAISGEPILPEEEIRALIGINEGDVFSQLSVTQTESMLQRVLGNEGYSAARVSGVPEVVSTNKDNADVVGGDNEAIKLTFFVTPGSISYVRRISFSGNTSTSDHVLRREMRQLEGAPVSTQKIEQSKSRLERLGFFGSVNVETRDVPGTIDQVDIEFSVTEQPTANINLSLGFSGDNGFNVGAGLQNNNWLGSGKNFGVNVQTGRSLTAYNLTLRDPFYTPDGVSRSVRFFFRQRDFDEIDVSNFASDTIGLNVNFGYPISETSRLSFGVGVQNISIQAGTTAPQEVQGSPILRDGVENASVSRSFFENNILPAIGESGNNVAENIDDADTNNNDFIDEFDNFNGLNDSELNDLIVDGNSPSTDSSGFVRFDPSTIAQTQDTPEGFLDEFGDDFTTLTFDLGWTKSTLNRGLFPTKGSSQRFSAEVAAPGGDLEFFKLTYSNNSYFPLSNSTALHLRGRFGYADSYGDIDQLPFFENFLSGGIGSVRGFENSTLGPKGTPANAFVAVPVAISTTGDPLTPGDVDVDDLDFVYVRDTNGQFLTAGVDDDDLDTIGGNILVELSAELIVPIPFIGISDKARLSLFVDAGNVFSTDCGVGQANCDNIDLGNLSVAAGVSVQWLSPVGPLSFNLSSPIQEQPFDEPESFQFTLGRSF